MKGMMSLMMSLSLIAAPGLMPAAGYAQTGIAGRWSGEQLAAQGRGVVQPIAVDLRLDGENLSGTVTEGALEPKPISNAAVDGTTFSFRTTQNFGGQDIVVNWFGELKGEQLELTRAVGPTVEVPGGGGAAGGGGGGGRGGAGAAPQGGAAGGGGGRGAGGGAAAAPAGPAPEAGAQAGGGARGGGRGAGAAPAAEGAAQAGARGAGAAGQGGGAAGGGANAAAGGAAAGGRGAAAGGGRGAPAAAARPSVTRLTSGTLLTLRRSN